MSNLPVISTEAEYIFPEMAVQPDDVRLRFSNLLGSYTHWLSASPEMRSRILRVVAAELRCSKAAVSRLFHKVKESQDYRMFLPATRSDAGIPRVWDPHVIEYLRASYLRLRDKQRAYNETRDTFRLTDAKMGSYRRACQYLKKMDAEDKALIAIANKEKDYYDQFETPIMRDKKMLSPLEIICGDHHQFDVLVIWPDGSIVRPWASAWCDVRCNYWLSFTICRTPDAKSIADSLYNVITRYGVPMNVYIDNGKAYKAAILKGSAFELSEIGRLDLDDETRQRLELLQGGLYGASRVIHALPYNSRAKIIERMFGTGGFTDWAKTLPGWTGRRYDVTPDDTKKRIKTRQLMTLSEFLTRLIYFVQEWNNRPSRGRDMGGVSPAEVMAWYINHGWKPRFVPDRRIVDFMAMNTATRVVKRYGLQIAGQKDEPMYYFDQKLQRYIGSNVIVKWASSDLVLRKLWSANEEGTELRPVPRMVHVFTEKGEFVCSATPLTRTEYIDDPNTAENLKKQRRQRKVVRDQVKEMDEFRKHISLSGGAADVDESAPELQGDGKLRLVKVDKRSDIEKEVLARRKKSDFREILKREGRCPGDEGDDGETIKL